MEKCLRIVRDGEGGGFRCCGVDDAVCALWDACGCRVRGVFAGEHPPHGMRMDSLSSFPQDLGFSLLFSHSFLMVQAQCGYAADEYVECEMMVISLLGILGLSTI